MSNGEVLKVVFPLLEGTDLATCMAVCKHWRVIALDDYFWKCLCAKRWPSLCKRPSSPIVSYFKMFKMFYKRCRPKTILPPRLSSNDLEFYIDIWAEQTLLFSEVVPGPALMNGILTPPPGVSNLLKVRLEGTDFKMALPVEPRFTIPLSQTISLSVLVGRKDSKFARIVNTSVFDYIDQTANRALAYDYLDFSPSHPFVSGIRAWVSLLFVNNIEEGDMNVFGIEMDFCDAANSQDEVLWLMDMLDWK